MRKILFRGKRVDNGDWVEGFLCLKNIIKHTRKCFDWRGDYVCDSVEEHKVDSETIGQFIGLTDKNGKMIFEGDIVKCEAVYQEYEDEYLSNYNIEVKYSKGYFYPFYLNGCWRSGIENVEVIGNTYDNPELLKEKKV